ncbi:glycosyltransferase [Zobellella sp. An-6]|uniref:glycosyltransferase n=1 Tax=Zobellella sp. An-6 TaxID=3400218 RepID=UPI0040411C6B
MIKYLRQQAARLLPGKVRAANAMQTAEERLLRESGLFNPKWYLLQNPDVAAVGADPVRHYLRHGWREGREPGPAFDTGYYLEQQPGAAAANMAPLLHYLQVGKAQGAAPKLQWSTAPWWWSLSSSTHSEADHARLTRLATTGWPVIIIPVFNAATAVAVCLESVRAYTPSGCRILVINDSSTDAAIVPLLKQYEAVPGFEVFTHAHNKGYTHTVNKGIALAGQADVILLNSDTCVSAGWVQRLRWAACSHPKVATVTPFSNNAGAFSAPVPGVNPLLQGTSLAECARAIAQASGHYLPAVPTGNGFCMYMRRACLDDIGHFDEAAFPRGYGEENDFCMRAGAQGWLHLIDDSTYIAHQRSASFGSAKDALLQAGRAVVDARYPHYTEQVRQAFSAPVLQQARSRVGTALRQCTDTHAQIRPRVLYVISTRTGGTPQTNQDLMQALAPEVEALVLHCTGQRIVLEHFTDGVYTEINSHTLAEPISALPHKSKEYDAVVAHWLMQWSIELVHIRHIAWHSLGLLEVTFHLGIPTIFSFHDFYTLCPTVKLLDDKKQFCAARCTAGEGHCQHELWPESSFNHLKHGQIHAWQSAFEQALSLCDTFITTTEFTRNLLLQRYSALANKPFRIIPHGRDFAALQQLAICPSNDKPLRMVVPGNLSEAKGGKLIQALAEQTPPQLLQIHLLGDLEPGLQMPDHVIFHGKYRRNEFAQKIAEIRPHLGAVLSIWPETWCHTLTELWACGIPVVGMNTGAVGERIASTEAGWLLHNADVTELRSLLITAAKQDEWQQKVNAVHQWQQNDGITSTTGWMGKQYLNVYQQTSPIFSVHNHAFVCQIENSQEHT